MDKLFLFVISILLFWMMYKVWLKPDDFIERMLDIYEDPGDFNRWLVEKGIMKWFYRLTVTIMFFVMVYISLKYNAWLW